MSNRGGVGGAIKLNAFPDPGDRFKLEEILTIGNFGKTYLAKDCESPDGKLVIVKIQEINPINEKYLRDEYKLLRDVAAHPNIVDFYDAFSAQNELLLVTEYCDGGNVLKLVNDLLIKNRRMREEHIAHILKETIKAVGFLHEKHIIHRDLKASNILLNGRGEVKLAGFGLSITLASTFGRTNSSYGSPGWMAPEVIESKPDDDSPGYDNRCDVWSLGICAIEMGDGKNPFQDMHPTRVLFQIVRNPPPTVYRPSNWTDDYNDFISECLVKNPEHRPYVNELMEHPFIEQIPENNYHLSTELASLLSGRSHKTEANEEVHVKENVLFEGETRHDRAMYVEDLAALDEISEKIVLNQLEGRFKEHKYQTYVGEILVTLNSNSDENIYNEKYHAKYVMKSKSENVPHVFAIADGAYQDALHHQAPQKIVLTGESGSGKTTNYLNLLDHLLYIGQNANVQLSRMKNAVYLIHAFTHASTPYNDFSTRCLSKTDVIYGSTGKVSAVSFRISLLEKTRVSSVDLHQANFNAFYYIYDGLVHENLYEEYKLNDEREYRYLRILKEEKSERPRVEVEKNVKKFKKIKEILREFEFSNEERETIFSCMCAILLLGEIRFREKGGENVAEIANVETAKNVAKLLDIDEKKFCWALTNYCVLRDGVVASKKNDCDEARDTRDVLANNLYSRLVDFIVAHVNRRLAIGKAIFGEKYRVQIYDYFGFECFKSNELSQLFINIFNEQMQHYYVQRIFKWETVDSNEDKIDFEPVSYYNNQKLLDVLLGRSDGILNIIGQASKMEHNAKYVTEYISNMDSGHVSSSKHMEFSVSHYTGKLNYNAKEMPIKNRDYLPLEIIETMRKSKNPSIKLLFTTKLNKTGNLSIDEDEDQDANADNRKKKDNPNRFSQSKKLRTLTTIFKSACLENLKELSTGSTSSGGTHFIRCLKTNLKASPTTFCRELVKQQSRAMAIAQTARIRKQGYAYRINFNEFLKRYQFLAFDFDETVDITPDNCRLLLIRLKMEGWKIGKKRVFLKYYNEEYLARLYEYQVKKIIKIQSILRGFLTKCQMKKQGGRMGKNAKTGALKGDKQMKPKEEKSLELSEDEAAQVIQKAYRKRANKNDESGTGNQMNDRQLKLVKPYAKRWKKSTFFSLLAKIRAKRNYDIFNLSMQVFLYNQKTVFDLENTFSKNGSVALSNIDDKFGKIPKGGRISSKINYDWQNLPFFDNSDMVPEKNSEKLMDEVEDLWDGPFRWKNFLSSSSSNDELTPETTSDNLTNHPFTRNPDENLDEFKERFPEPSNRRNESKNRFESDTKSANKDFDYIRTKKAAPSYNAKAPSIPYVDPVAELKTLAQSRRRESANSDDPPFNFQGMLRKTNYKRDSMKTIANVRRISFKNKDDNSNNKNCHISLELSPELLLEGTLYDL